jgi:two-component system, OmpR family, sensor kinase
VSGVEFMPQPVAPPQEPDESSALGEPGEEALGSPVRPGRRLWLRSLTSRLVVGVVSLVVVLVVSIGTCTYFALRSFLDTRLDQQLQTTARGANVLFHTNYQSGPRPTSVWAVALDPTSGAVLDYPAGQGIVALHLASSARKAIAHTPSNSAVTVETTDGEEVRVTTRPARIGPVDDPINSGVPATVVIGLSTDDEHRTLARLISLEVIIGGAAILLAFGATTWGVRRSLRNLYQVTGTAREVAAELSPSGAGLDRRVPVTDEGSEVGQLAESMNTLLAAVETQFAARLESEQRMRQFLADASHELRTPLTSIRGYAELARMQRTANGDRPATDADNLDRIESEGTRMSRLVDDLLLLARGDADAEAARAVHRELLDLAGILDDAVSGSRAAFPDRPIDLELGALPAVVGDRDQLLRVVRNLVNNAAVHTEAGRPIRVHGFADAGGAVVTVADGGPGLPPDQAAHVFERFWRADKARTRARGGTGLGLSIVAAIVRAHGGSVRFDSTVEGGSTVTVWLPAAG